MSSILIGVLCNIRNSSIISEAYLTHISEIWYVGIPIPKDVRSPQSQFFKIRILKTYSLRAIFCFTKNEYFFNCVAIDYAK